MFGLPMKDEQVAYWGARAISDGPGIFGLLPDRQSLSGNYEPLVNALNKQGLLQAIRKSWEKTDPVYVNDLPPFVLIDTEFIKAEARRSYGYIHIGVILKKLPEDSQIIFKPEPEVKKKTSSKKSKLFA